MKLKPNRNMIEASKITSKEPTISKKEKRVFGTVRNTNITTRTTIDKPAIKPPIGVPQNQPQRIRPSRLRPVTEVAKKNSPENAKPKLNERTPRHQEKSQEKTLIAGSRTPVVSPSLSEPKTKGSMYRNAEICSKCRFDKLETSSY
ncbi:hypothetical protein PanWU01x14_198570 [Parasponia andersonii]|uniref:Uncharacterized protein n=1 Tax=Parasponia andersonii TaxID=3476 RepID=A0A2P5BYZ6_PARAD|nr:hypothetical protein PanWU01x14_198570 [Parasponia andersonii]